MWQKLGFTGVTTKLMLLRNFLWNNNCEMNWNSNKGGTSFVLAHLSGGGTGSALDLLSIKSILFLCSVCNTKGCFMCSNCVQSLVF